VPEKLQLAIAANFTQYCIKIKKAAPKPYRTGFGTAGKWKGNDA
jgi:hypothetical protein